MDLPVEKWFPAIALRTSRRNFDAAWPGEEKLARLETVCHEFRPFPEARAELVHEPAAGVFKGIIGAYGRIRGARCYLAFIGDTRSAQVQECTGYTGEGLILEATALGLDSCWVGGFFGRDSVSSQVRLDGAERVLAISPVGRATPKPGFTDRSFKLFAGSGKRKPLSELVLGGIVPDGEVRKGLEAARLAPSAVNRQPWRFIIEDGAVVIRTDKAGEGDRISRRLDCGIAMLHFELGARVSGLTGRWEFLPSPEVARFRFGLK